MVMDFLRKNNIKKELFEEAGASIWKKKEKAKEFLSIFKLLFQQFKKNRIYHKKLTL